MMRLRLGMATVLAGLLAISGLPAAAAEATAPYSLEVIVGPALYVTDPERSLKFWRDAMGMQVRMRFGPKDRPDLVIGFGPDPTQAGIMLITDKEGAPRAIEHGHGFDRIALRLPDLHSVNDRLRAAGFAPGEIRIVHGGVVMMMVTDPDGYRVELIDSKPAPRAK